MFESQDQDCVFMETHMNPRRRQHMVLECVPLPRELGDMAPIYYKVCVRLCIVRPFVQCNEPLMNPWCGRPRRVHAQVGDTEQWGDLTYLNNFCVCGPCVSSRKPSWIVTRSGPWTRKWSTSRRRISGRRYVKHGAHGPPCLWILPLFICLCLFLLRVSPLD